jgi:hypothetical protein
MTASPRFDIYVLVHMALRAAMTHALTAVGRQDWHDDADTAAALAQVRALLALARTHLAKENEFLHRALEARRPGSSAAAAHDHAQQEESIVALEALVARIESAPAAARAADARRLYHALALFVAENFEHMHVEETELNAVLWAAYTDDELRAIHDSLVASVEPQQMAEVVRWMVPNIAPAERALMLGDMQRKAPAEVFSRVLDLVRPALSARDWDKLMKALAPLPAAA